MVGMAELRDAGGAAVSVFLADPDVMILLGDAAEQLRTLPDESVHMAVTSPPFYGLRDYGVDGQIGLEESPDEWAARLVEVCREVRRVLRRDGTLWLEVGDSYANGGYGDPSPSSTITGGKNRTGGTVGVRRKPDWLKPKDLVMAPALLAMALREPYYAGRIRHERDRVWLAAIIDGEGSIGIHRRPAGTPAYSTYTKKDGTVSTYERTIDSFQPKLEITNTSLALLERVVALTGEGNTDTKQEAGTFGRKQTIYRWTVTADKARSVLREVYPHLVAKQHEARLAFGCPSSGEKATAAWEGLKLLHGGSETTVDFPEPPSLHEGGWYLRSDIVWARIRPNPMPESVTDRPTKAHSYVFLLAKSARYYFDADAIREPAEAPVGVYNGQRRSDELGSYGSTKGSGNPSVSHPAGRNKRSVWTIPTEPLKHDHYAAYPSKLVEPCILAGTSEHGVCSVCGTPWERETVAEETGQRYTGQRQNMRGDEFVRAVQGERTGKAFSNRTIGWRPGCDHDAPTVPATILDPFLGSGTTAIVARRLGRRCVGVELNEKYAELAAGRLAQQSLLAGDAA